MRILLLSAYDTISHRKWRECLTSELSVYTWEALTLPPRYFNYRVRTNAVSWFFDHKESLKKSYDLIIATSLCDIPTLKALNPSLSNVPTWLYCHENQFAYPKSKKQSIDHLLELKTAFYFNCLVADQISFNSEWNRSTALQGLRTLLKNWPEKLPQQSIDLIQDKSDVIPVPLFVSEEPLRRDSRKIKHLEILWNHRWEYDKGPELLLAFVLQLSNLLENSPDTEIKLHVAGQQFRKIPEAYSEIDAILSTLSSEHSNFERGEWGFIEEENDYHHLLRHSDVVLSTSLHDFQGLAIQEAVALGCVPLLPNTLVYPEIFSNEYLYNWSENTTSCAKNAIEKLQHWITSKLPETPDTSKFVGSQLLEPYELKIESFRKPKKLAQEAQL